MSTPIQLEFPNFLPRDIYEELISLDWAFKSATHLDAALNHQSVREIEQKIETYLQENSIQAYHCTREPCAGFFAKNGLRLTNLRAHQEEFLRLHGNIFTAEERQALKQGWNQHFLQDPSAMVGRNNMVWVSLSRPTHPGDGTDRFLEYFGGEAIYWPFIHGEFPAIAAKLNSIGSPVIVELSIPGRDLKSFLPIARHVLNCRHQALHPAATRPRAEARILRNVLPSEVLQVTPKHNFLP